MHIWGLRLRWTAQSQTSTVWSLSITQKKPRCPRYLKPMNSWACFSESSFVPVYVPVLSFKSHLMDRGMKSVNPGNKVYGFSTTSGPLLLKCLKLIHCKTPFWVWCGSLQLTIQKYLLHISWRMWKATFCCNWEEPSHFFIGLCHL